MRPTRLLVLLGAALAVAGVAAGFWPVAAEAWRGLAAALVTAAVVDLGRARRSAPVRVRRRSDSSLPVNVKSTVRLGLWHENARPLRVRVAEHLPDHVEVRGLPAAVVVHPGRAATLEYAVVPRRRGDLHWPAAELLVRSPWGLWETRCRAGQGSSARIYPDFSALAGYLEMVSDRHLARVGIKIAPQRGEGLEFHQLREFRHGDALRQVDWKATARRRTLISREYQEERDQQILFMVDAGRQMRSRDGELSLFDHALNATLLLAYVALRQGDSVSALLFGGEPRWVPPVRGLPAINTLLNAVYDAHSSTAASDWLGAAEAVMSRQRKRALVVLLTSLRETDYDLAPALALLRRRHALLLANLRDPELDRALGMEPRDFDEALLVAGAGEYQSRRRERQRVHQRHAHLVLDALPQELPAQVVNGYWLIKRAGAV